jgi:hypothetical protein
MFVYLVLFNNGTWQMGISKSRALAEGITKRLKNTKDVRIIEPTCWEDTEDALWDRFEHLKTSPHNQFWAGTDERNHRELRYFLFLQEY